jgi:hypothetical protein
MQNGGQRAAVFIFLLECVLGATKKTKKRLAATGRDGPEIILRRDFEGYPPSRVKKK